MSNKFEIKSTRPPFKMTMAISRKERGMSLEKIKAMLGYNIITIKQLSELTGKKQDRISMMSLPNANPKAHKSDFELTRVYPFETSDSVGPIFIVRDEQCNKFILECNK